jgi:hypothetical protein
MRATDRTCLGIATDRLPRPVGERSGTVLCLRDQSARHPEWPCRFRREPPGGRVMLLEGSTWGGGSRRDTVVILGTTPHPG